MYNFGMTLCQISSKTVTNIYYLCVPQNIILPLYFYSYYYFVLLQTLTVVILASLILFNNMAL